MRKLQCTDRPGRSCAELCGSLPPQTVLIEVAANGPGPFNRSHKLNVSLLLPIFARGSKVSRAHIVEPLLEAGKVRFHHCAPPLVKGLPRFPKGTKDHVDAFGHAAM